MMMIQPRPPPKTATSQEEMQAKMMTPVLWYQSALVSGLYAHIVELRHTTIEGIRKLSLDPCRVIEETLLFGSIVNWPS
jgi:hypothetical protein